MPRKKLRVVRVPHRKSTQDMQPVRMPCPSQVVLPMSMHIGAPAVPVVKVGDPVFVGQPIAQAGGFVSAPIHSPVSGKVKKISDMLVFNGRRVATVILEADGAQTVWEGVKPPVVETADDFVRAVADSGIVGLGGAGFPTAVKLNIKEPEKIDAIIVNGAECEPYITSDTRTMLDESDLIMEGAELLQKYLGNKRIIFAIEGNKPACISLFEKLTKEKENMEVKALEPRYPQGGEKVLIYHTLHRLVPEGKLPLDVGAVVINCTTLAAIAKYINTGMPLTEKCVTVDGSAVKEPKNVIVPIGTSMQEVFDFCGGFKTQPKKLLYGGPMMGIAVPDANQPILKNTNAILALDEKEAAPPIPTECIRCGRCINNCPLNLMPSKIERAYNSENLELLTQYKVHLCMECGCCSFVCPARRPLVQTNKLAKAKVLALLKEKEAKEAVKK